MAGTSNQSVPEMAIELMELFTEAIFGAGGIYSYGPSYSSYKY